MLSQTPKVKQFSNIRFWLFLLPIYKEWINNVDEIEAITPPVNKLIFLI